MSGTRRAPRIPGGSTRSWTARTAATAWAPLAVGVLVSLVLAGVVRQLHHPYLEHDDWSYLLPVDHERQQEVFAHMRAEGRWLDWIFWRGPGHLLTPTVAAWAFEALYVVFVAVLARRWARSWLVLPVFVALFASPMVAGLMFWPATLWPSVLLLAAAALSLPWCTGNRWRLGAWIFVATLLTFLSYPPFSIVVLLILLVAMIDRPWRHSLYAYLVFGVGYGLGALIAFSTNLFVFGQFGLQILPWRQPNKLHSLADLGENLSRCWTQLTALAQVMAVPLIVGVVAVVVCLATEELRTRTWRLLVIAAALLAVELSTTVLTGATTPFRGSLWVWWWLVLLAVLLAVTASVDRLRRAVGVVALLVLAGWGLHFAYGAMTPQQDRLTTMNGVENSIDQLLAQQPGSKVVLYGTAADWPQATFGQDVRYISSRLYQEERVRSTSCKPQTCPIARRPGVLADVAAGKQVFSVGKVIVVVPPAHAALGY